MSKNVSTRISPTLQSQYAAADFGTDFERLENAINETAASAVATIERLQADATLPEAERRRRSLLEAQRAHKRAVDHLSQLNVCAYREAERTEESIRSVIGAHARAHTVQEARGVAIATLREAGGNLDRALAFAAAIVTQRDGPLAEAVLGLTGAMAGMEPDKLVLVQSKVRMGFAPHEAQRLDALERYYGQLEHKLSAINQSLQLTTAQTRELETLEENRQHGGLDG